MSPTVGNPYNPWLLYGGLTIPGWLLVRPELSLGAKLLAAYLWEEQIAEEERKGELVPILVGVEDPVRDVVEKYCGNAQEVIQWLAQLAAVGIVWIDERTQRYLMNVPNSWQDPTYERNEKGEPVYTEHGSGKPWMGHETVIITSSEGDDE